MSLLGGWERRRTSMRPVAAVSYALLAVLAAFAAGVERAPAVDLALCGAFAVWIGWMTLLPAERRRRGAVVAVFFTGLVALTAALVLRQGLFGFLTPIGYICAFRMLVGPWRMAGVGAVAVVAATAQASELNKATGFGLTAYAAILALNILLMCGATWVEQNADKRNQQRDQALAEAREANSRLEASLAENAGLHEQLLIQAREAGVLDERQRMAREIHDTIAQGLTGIITQLQAAEQAADDPGGWRRHFAAATMLARESLTEARRSVEALRPEPLEVGRLGDALTKVAERWTGLHGIPVQVTVTGTGVPMPPEAEVALLRTAQEALANISHHAEASRVWMTLSYLEHQVALDVGDDGRGFDPSAPVSPKENGGFGLLAMRQRIEGIAGTLQVESEPGGGTTLSACVPAVTKAVPAVPPDVPAAPADVPAVPTGEGT
jgi:signal transduction histidine kinase